jgi:Transposase
MDTEVFVKIQAGAGVPMGVFPGGGRRRAWTMDQQTQILAESYGSGAKVSAVARRHGLPSGSCSDGAGTRGGEMRWGDDPRRAAICAGGRGGGSGVRESRLYSSLPVSNVALIIPWALPASCCGRFSLRAVASVLVLANLDPRRGCRFFICYRIGDQKRPFPPMTSSPTRLAGR